MFVCFNIALRVPSCISPVWLGIVVYRFDLDEYQIYDYRQLADEIQIQIFGIVL